MPFQSEKQRRYLWANEPEIARDWADTYGSRVENNAGGINRLGFANGPNWQVAEEEDDDENYLEKFISMMQGNAGKLSKEDIIANKNFLKNYNVGFAPNNPYQMTSGPFKGMNAPGTSALGSKTSTEMAQKWMDKYGGIDHKSPAMQEKKAEISKMAGYNAPNHPSQYATGGRIGFEAGSKDYLDFKKWFDNQQQMGKEQSIHDLYEQYEREKRDKKVYDQKHMAATGGIMRLGYAQGNPHQDQDPGLGMSPGEAQARGLSAIHHGSTTSGNLHAGNVGGEGGKNQAQGIGPVIDTGANILQGILPFMDPKKANMFGLGLSIYDIIKNKDKVSEKDMTYGTGDQVTGPGNYSQNEVANQLFGTSFNVLDPFQQGQVNDAINTYGTTSLGTIKT